MEENSSDFSLSIPRSRPLTEGDFEKLIHRFRNLFRALAATHELFAHLITMEESIRACRIAFFDQETSGIPYSIIVVDAAKFLFINCRNGENESLSDVDLAVFRIINLIRVTAQHQELRKLPMIDVVMQQVHAAPSKSSPVAASASSIHV